MYKTYIRYLLLAVLCLNVLTACQNTEPDQLETNSRSPVAAIELQENKNDTQPDKNPTEKEEQNQNKIRTIESDELETMESNASLVVNGKDITEGNYVTIFDDRRNGLIPIVAVLRELGYETEWNNPSLKFKKDGEWGGLATSHPNSTWFCTEQELFVDVDFIDSIFYHSYNIEIQINNATNTISVAEFDPIGERIDAKLVVNGTEITNIDHIKIQSNSGVAEVPLMATFRTLGANVQLNDNILTISYEGKTRRYDLSDEYLGIEILMGGAGHIRLQLEDDIIVDLPSIREDLFYIANMEYDVDVEEKTVYLFNQCPYCRKAECRGECQQQPIENIMS